MWCCVCVYVCGPIRRGRNGAAGCLREGKGERGQRRRGRRETEGKVAREYDEYHRQSIDTHCTLQKDAEKDGERD